MFKFPECFVNEVSFVIISRSKKSILDATLPFGSVKGVQLITNIFKLITEFLDGSVAHMKTVVIMNDVLLEDCSDIINLIRETLTFLRIPEPSHSSSKTSGLSAIFPAIDRISELSDWSSVIDILGNIVDTVESFLNPLMTIF